MLKEHTKEPYYPGRAGSYSTTKDGWRAFHPKPLPPDPPLNISQELLTKLSEASIALGRLDGIAEVLPDPDFFVYSYIRKEAVLSSQIEGTRSSLVDLLDFEAGAERQSYPRDVGEVVNYVFALKEALKHVEQGRPISLPLIAETHKLLLHKVRGHNAEPGRFKSRQNWIGPLGSSPATADYVPPPPEETAIAMGGLVSYAQSGSKEPPLLRAALVHSQYETIHPFLDGNGRMGRLLVILLLSKWRVLHRPVLYLSYFFLKNRPEYNLRLQRVRDDGDWEGWVEFFLDGVDQSADQAIGTARAVLALRTEHTALIQQTLSKRAASGRLLMEHLFHKPVLSVKEVAKIIGTTFPPANDLVEELVRIGVLKEITGQKRNRFFRYQPYIDILQKDQLVAPPEGPDEPKSLSDQGSNPSALGSSSY
jgi:Fic family protein